MIVAEAEKGKISSNAANIDKIGLCFIIYSSKKGKLKGRQKVHLTVRFLFYLLVTEGEEEAVREIHNRADHGCRQNVPAQRVEYRQAGTENRLREVRPHPCCHGLDGKTRCRFKRRTCIVDECIHINIFASKL